MAMPQAGAGRVDWRRIGLRVTTVLWFISGLAFLLTVPIILQASPLVLVGLIAIACVVAGIGVWLVGKLRNGGHRHTRSRWLKTAVALTFLLTVVAASPVYYLATITQFKPAMVPVATLSNGKRIIVFQGMQHVATEPFFKSVVYDLEDALSRGYILFYEGVKPADPASNAWFDKTITGGADLGTAYRQLAGICGLRFQSDYFGLLGRDAQVHPASHIVADVSTSQLRAEYDRLMRTDSNFAEAMRAKENERESGDGGGGDGIERLVTFLKTGTPGQQEMAGILCRGFMTMVMRRSGPPGKGDEQDKLILSYRNQALASALIADPHRHIYVTYGAAHLPGVLKILQRNDPRWRMISVKWLRTIDRPDTLVGTI